MVIQVLHNRQCTFWQLAYQTIQDTLKEKGIGATIEEILIADDAEATRYHFFGSPQIMVNGKDIDPMAEKMTTFHESGCRLYFYGGDVYDYPPRKMLEEAIFPIAPSV